MTPNDFPSLEATLNWTLNELSRAGVDRKSAFRWPVLATNDSSQPEARVVVMRSFTRNGRKALIYSDQRTPKITHLLQNPHAALTFFDPKRSIQIRATGIARIIMDGDEHAVAWQKLTDNARRDYTTTQAPGTRVATSTPADSHDSSSHFAMIEITVHLIDWLLLSRQGHLRAHFQWEHEVLSQAWVTP